MKLLTEPRKDAMAEHGDRSDPVDWSEAYRAHAGDLFGFLARRVGRELAEDLLANIFEVAMGSIHTFDPSRGAMRGWLFGIASNLVRRHWRSEERRLHALARDAVTPEPAVRRSDTRRRPLLHESDASPARELETPAALPRSAGNYMVVCRFITVDSNGVGCGVQNADIPTVAHRRRRPMSGWRCRWCSTPCTTTLMWPS